MVPKLSASTKDNNYAANTSSNDVVVTQNNTYHISNSQETAKSQGRDSYDMCPKNKVDTATCALARTVSISNPKS